MTMRPSAPAREAGRPTEERAAVYIDYENLYALAAARAGERERPDEFIAELLEALKRHLNEAYEAQPTVITAYADFGELRENGYYIQRALYLQGAEARFVPTTLQSNAAELQLCVDAVDTLYSRPDVRMVVLLTGDRLFLPLVQQVRRHGRRALVVALDPPSLSNTPFADDFLVDAAGLLDKGAYRRLKNGAREERTPMAPAVAPRPLSDPAALTTLEIIEEHFGQYDEVYLTPLLRKLSAEFTSPDYDPKTVINVLEEHGAAQLFKRRGYPHDYTVLILNGEHEDVRRVREQLRDEDDDYDGEAYYDDDEDDDYDGEAYYDDDEDDDYYEEEEDSYEEDEVEAPHAGDQQPAVPAPRTRRPARRA